MSRLDEYHHWPFLTHEEFELACAYLDVRYIRAELGPKRPSFKIRVRQTATTGATYVEIIRLLRPPEDVDELALALGKLGGTDGRVNSSEMDVDLASEDADEEALQNKWVGQDGSTAPTPPAYSLYSQQPYVTYEVHLHPTYRMPTLFFMLHDLPNGEPNFDLDSVYRYLVPDEFKTLLRAAGINGGISAAPHPITDVPAFFIHPCQSKEAMEEYSACPMTDYLMLWLGLVGGCVGLSIPLEMAEVEMTEMRSQGL